jgi:hypothetical protein
MKNRITADILICDFQKTPKEICVELGVMASKSWMKGDYRIPNAKAKHSENGLRISSNKSIYDSLDTHLSALVEILSPSIQKFKDVILNDKCYCEVSVAIYYYYKGEYSVPTIHFDRKQLKVFQEIGAEIDIDFYILTNLE